MTRLSFAKPPIQEVAISLQFERLSNLKVTHFGLLWSRFRNRYPLTSEHATIDPVIEKFGIPQGQPRVAWQQFDSPPLPRIWFEAEGSNNLLQFQSDRFIYNWRKTAEGDVYPGYEAVFGAFVCEFDILKLFIKEEGCGEFVPNQCELTYVNIVEQAEMWNSHSELGRVLSLVNDGTVQGLGSPEAISTNVRFVISNNEEPIGRLHLGVSPVRNDDGRNAFNLSLTARLYPGDGGEEGIAAAFSRGHDEVNRAFAELTTRAMHQHWGRTDV